MPQIACPKVPKKRARRSRVEQKIAEIEASSDLCGLTLRQLAALLERLDPDEYREPPKPPLPGGPVLRKTARIAVMMRRHHEGLAIAREDDPWRLDICGRVGITAPSAKSGQPQFLAFEGQV